jgi:alpha-N-arabinofuranosidase
MELRPETCQGTGNPSFIAFRQPHLNGWASTTIDFEAQAENEKAGLMVFQNETHYYYICISMKGKDRVVELYKGAGGKDNSEPPILVASDKLKSGKNKSVVLIISTTPAGYTFYYSVQRHKEVQLGPELDAKFLSTKTAGGFVGAMYVLYATSNGKESKNRAYFERFKCYNGDHVYD